jgi:2OG-Fe(II) oxygenase superfamily
VQQSVDVPARSAGSKSLRADAVAQGNQTGSPGAGGPSTGRSAVIPSSPAFSRFARCPPDAPDETSLVKQPVFSWTTFDLTSRLPGNWQPDIAAAAVGADFREFPPTPILSREAADVRRISRGRLPAAGVKQQLPWLYELYRDEFLRLAQAGRDEPVAAALDDRYGIVLNVQRGTTMRFECHVDSNPLTGLLFCTDHRAGEGGELVFGHDSGAAGIGAVERDCAVIRPQAGHLIFFDGRHYPHYARPLRSEADTRIVAVMNFYTESCPESDRPLELNRHRFGDD